MAVSRMVTVSWCSVATAVARRGETRSAFKRRLGLVVGGAGRRRSVRPALVALLGEELERLVDELPVELEDAAVAGVGIDDQIRVWQALVQVDSAAAP